MNLGLGIRVPLDEICLIINPTRHFIANQAGLGYLTPLGVESLKDNIIVDIRKNNHFAASKEAIRH
jgi:hypothetical protein